MESTEIRKVAQSGTDKAVNKLYKEIFGRDISHCKPCQKQDARVFLLRYATNLEAGNTSTYRLKRDFVMWQHIQGLGDINPLTPEKVAAILSGPFAYILEPINDPNTGKEDA